MIVGFCGRAGAGKDTAAARLISTFGFTRMAFADPIKAAVAGALGVDVSVMEDRSKRENVDPDTGLSNREMMQKFGTEVGRAIDRDLWVKIWCGRVRRFTGLSRIVATDVRFRNESSAIHELGGIVVLVRNDAAESKPSHHESESFFQRLAHDLEIDNNGTVEDLNRLIDGVVYPRIAIKKPTASVV